MLKIRLKVKGNKSIHLNIDLKKFKKKEIKNSLHHILCIFHSCEIILKPEVPKSWNYKKCDRDLFLIMEKKFLSCNCLFLKQYMYIEKYKKHI